MKTIRILAIFCLVSATASASSAKEIRTNCCIVQQAPAWLNVETVKNTAKRIESRLQWTIRRVTIRFEADPERYKTVSTLQFPTRALFNPKNNTVYFGPSINADNFAPTLGHELVHVVFQQKHRKAIPAWLEEGFANFIGAETIADYRFLNSETIPKITSLGHPNSDPDRFRMHYQLASAAVDYISSRCKLNDLLMMSVKRSVEDYLQKLCKIKDIDSELVDWVKSKNPDETKKL
jgi:hypothetical protein